LKSQTPLSIPGIDTAKGIFLTGGTEEFYRRILDLFQKSVRERLPGLQTVPEADALPVFIIEVHTLKSMCASIGAAILSAEAAALESAGKAGDFAFIKDNLRGFTERIREMAENIHTALE